MKTVQINLSNGNTFIRRINSMLYQLEQFIHLCNIPLVKMKSTQSVYAAQSILNNEETRTKMRENATTKKE